MEKFDAGCGERSDKLFLNDSPRREKEKSKLNVSTRASFKHRILQTTDLVDLDEEEIKPNVEKAKQLRNAFHATSSLAVSLDDASGLSDDADYDPVLIIRQNLPPDPLLHTPFGARRMTYADYTASGRSLHFVEEYIQRVVYPLYANTHTETSASGLQTTHAREEARAIILNSLNAPTQDYSLIFMGNGVTAAIWKLIAILGIHCPTQLRPHLDESSMTRPLVLISHSEHHSNELMWRETIADVIPIPTNNEGSLDLIFLRSVLEEQAPNYDLIIGSFSAGSNVTGLITKPGPVAKLLHEFHAFLCFDYAGAGPYVDLHAGGDGRRRRLSGRPLYLPAQVCGWARNARTTRRETRLLQCAEWHGLAANDCGWRDGQDGLAVRRDGRGRLEPCLRRRVACARRSGNTRNH